MGCCYSLSSKVDYHSQEEAYQNHGDFVSYGEGEVGGSILTKFSFSNLTMATKNFSLDNIISETGHDANDIVYKGRLHNFGIIVVKRFMNMAWLDPTKFEEEAQRIGNIRHKRIVKLIGYCCDGDERLLVAEFMPNDTLAKRLFHRKKQTMEWSMRLKVAYCIADALDNCNISGFASYNNLSAYTVLFDKDGDACLSCFGLMKEINANRKTNGSVHPENVIYRFGTILIILLSGKQVPLSHAPELIHEKSVIELIDPKLEGKFSLEEATIFFKLASQCLQYENRESLNTKELLATLEAFQTKTDAPFHEFIEMKKHKEASWNQPSPLAKACSRMDLITIHKILVVAEYEDDNEVTEFSFEEWTQDMKDIQYVRKCGDQAFVEQDFEVAIDCYSQFIEARRVVYPSVYVRRSLCYLFCNHPERGLLDAMHAQEIFPEWPTAFYLQSVALAKLNMNTDSSQTLKEAILLEEKRQQNKKES